MNRSLAARHAALFATSLMCFGAAEASAQAEGQRATTPEETRPAPPPRDVEGSSDAQPGETNSEAADERAAAGTEEPSDSGDAAPSAGQEDSAADASAGDPGADDPAVDDAAAAGPAPGARRPAARPAEPTSPAPGASGADQPPPLTGPAGEGSAGTRSTEPGESRTGGGEYGPDMQAPTTEGLQPADSQPHILVGLLLESSLAVGSTKDFVQEYSFQGFGIDVRYLGFGDLWVGGAVAWHTLAQQTEKSVEWQNATITGNVVTELSTTPLTLKAAYAYTRSKHVVPYVALGGGASRVVRRLDIGIQRFAWESWHWTLVPELGVDIPVGPIDVLLATKFNYLWASAEAPEQLYMNFSFGIGLK